LFFGPFSLGQGSSTPSSSEGYQPAFQGGQPADYVNEIKSKLQAAYPGISGFVDYTNQPSGGTIAGTGQPQAPTTNALGFRYSGPSLFEGQQPSTVDALLANAPLPAGAAAQGSGGAGPASLGVPVSSAAAGSSLSAGTTSGTNVTGSNTTAASSPFDGTVPLTAPAPAPVNTGLFNTGSTNTGSSNTGAPALKPPVTDGGGGGFAEAGGGGNAPDASPDASNAPSLEANDGVGLGLTGFTGTPTTSLTGMAINAAQGNNLTGNLTGVGRGINAIATLGLPSPMSLINGIPQALGVLSQLAVNQGLQGQQTDGNLNQAITEGINTPGTRANIANQHAPFGRVAAVDDPDAAPAGPAPEGPSTTGGQVGVPGVGPNAAGNEGVGLGDAGSTAAADAAAAASAADAGVPGVGPNAAGNEGVGIGATGGDAGDGGGGGGGGSVICTLLAERKLIDGVRVRANHAFLRQMGPVAFAGYQRWAGPMVRLARRSPFAFKVLYGIGGPLVRAYMTEIEHRGGYRDRGSLLGRALLGVGVRFSRWLGARTAGRLA